MGRKKAYIEEEVLQKAMRCFWVNGYANTSTRLLEKEMGINQFSIYSSFGSKSDLYAKVLENYMTMMKRTYMKNLMRPNVDINDVQKFLNAFGLAMATHKIPGSCLMIRSMVNYEVFSANIQKCINEFSFWMEQLYTKALTNSIDKGLIRNTISVADEAQYLMGITQSLSIMNKYRKKNEIEHFINYSLAKLK